VERPTHLSARPEENLNAKSTELPDLPTQSRHEAASVVGAPAVLPEELLSGERPKLSQELSASDDDRIRHEEVGSSPTTSQGKTLMPGTSLEREGAEREANSEELAEMSAAPATKPLDGRRFCINCGVREDATERSAECSKASWNHVFEARVAAEAEQGKEK